MFPSKKAMERQRGNLREMIGPKVCFKPITALIQEVNRQLMGWANYFGQGYPRQAFRDVNFFVQSRLIRQLKRRSQRPFQPPKGVTWYAQLHRLGLTPL